MPEVKSLTLHICTNSKEAYRPELSGNWRQQIARPPCVCNELDNIDVSGEEWTYRDRYSDAIREIYKFCDNALPGICCHGRR